MAGPDIRTAIEKINTIQGAITITPLDVAPGVSRVKRVYKYWPDSAFSISMQDTPCWINEWTLDSLTYGPALMRSKFTVHMLLLYANADSDIAADVISAFMPKVAEAFASKIKLDGYQPVSIGNFRGGNPTLVSGKYGQTDYLGLDFYLELDFNQSQTNAA